MGQPLLPVGGSGAPGVVFGAESGIHGGSSTVKALSLASHGEHGAGNLAPVPTSVQSDFIAKGVALAVLDVEGLVQIHALYELLGGDTGINGLIVISKVHVVLDAVDSGLEVVPLAAVRPDPLSTLGGGNNAIFNLVAKVEMQDVQASIEGLVAIVQSRGNGKVSAM